MIYFKGEVLWYLVTTVCPKCYCGRLWDLIWWYAPSSEQDTGYVWMVVEVLVVRYSLLDVHGLPEVPGGILDQVSQVGNHILKILIWVKLHLQERISVQCKTGNMNEF